MHFRSNYFNKIMCQFRFHILLANIKNTLYQQKSNQHCLWCGVNGRCINGHWLFISAPANHHQMVSLILLDDRDINGVDLEAPMTLRYICLINLFLWGLLNSLTSMTDNCLYYLFNRQLCFRDICSYKTVYHIVRFAWIALWHEHLCF